MQIMDGKRVAAQVQNDVKERVKELLVRGITPCLAVVLVGDDPASQVYVRNKEKACKEVGIQSRVDRLDVSVTQEALLNRIVQLNQDPEVNGILVQLPLPDLIDEDAVSGAIDPKKDVDGVHPIHIGKLVIGQDGLLPCTPAGIIKLLSYYQISVAGKHCVMLGRSNIVGKPTALLLLQENGTVTICHSKTEDLAKLTKQADILICAAGKPRFVNASMVKESAVVIDVGIHRQGDGSLCGDVDYSEVAKKASAITPVPGGVGPMTIAMLMQNTWRAAKAQTMEQNG